MCHSCKDIYLLCEKIYISSFTIIRSAGTEALLIAITCIPTTLTIVTNL